MPHDPSESHSTPVHEVNSVRQGVAVAPQRDSLPSSAIGRAQDRVARRQDAAERPSQDEGVAHLGTADDDHCGQDVSNLLSGLFADRKKSSFVRSAERNYDAWDLNHDGTLQQGEIQRNLGNQDIKGEDAAALAEVANQSGGREFTRKQLEEDQKQWADKTDDKDGGDAEYQMYVQQINGRDKDKTLFGADGRPNVSDIHQGQLGDCWFLSAISARVEDNPNAVKNMIHDNGNGSYTVKFADGSVTVPAPTDAELARGADSNGNGTWLGVVEKAYAVYKNQKSPVHSFDPYAKISNGGFSRDAMRDISGIDATDHSYSTKGGFLGLGGADLGDERDRLADAMRGGYAVNAYTDDSRNGLPGDHAYQVVGYDAGSDTVVVRNPWGSVGGENPKVKDMGNGLFQMKYEDFFHTVGGVTISDKPWMDA